MTNENYEDDVYDHYDDDDYYDDVDDEYIERMNRENEEREKQLKEDQDAAEKRLDELAELIKSWDCMNAQTMCDYLNEFYQICDDRNLFFNGLDEDAEMLIRKVDMTSLPCADIDIDTDWSGIYAVDIDGYVVYPTSSEWMCEKFDPETDYLRK